MAPVTRRLQAEAVTVAVGAVVLDGTARVLLVRRGRAPGKGDWTLPGGRVEAGEALEDAVAREVREETGIAARVVCGLGVVAVVREGFSYAIHEHLLVPMTDSPNPTAGDDAEDARWAPREALGALGVRGEALAVVDHGLAEARARHLVPASSTSGAGLDLDRASRALLELGRALQTRRYHFVTVTPATHERVDARRSRCARGDRAPSLRDIFGWSRPFGPGALPVSMRDLLSDAGALLETDEGYRSAVRFSSLAGFLFLHSAYPTTQPEAVFFGPDTYRFGAMLLTRAPGACGCVVDVGCGSGAGGILLASRARRVVLADVNEEALRLARVNVALAGLRNVETMSSDVLSSVEGDIDLVISNPPYMVDAKHRAYRDGGGALGEALAVRIVVESLDRLRAGGRLLLYTGSPIVDGQDVFRRAVDPVLASGAAMFDYTEIDPDVFGEELDRPGYATVERIAVVCLDATRR
jgi:ADP-ribose pyrophosphatase YjhB (NUDIX family)/SAM-dependent methyltransferase